MKQAPIVGMAIRAAVEERDREWVDGLGAVKWAEWPKQRLADIALYASYIQEREKLAVEVEREACAKVAEQYGDGTLFENIASAIRARGA